MSEFKASVLIVKHLFIWQGLVFSLFFMHYCHLSESVPIVCAMLRIKFESINIIDVKTVKILDRTNSKF